MTYEAALTLAIGVVVSMSGWLVVHLFSKERDVRNKKREYRVQQLSQAYQKLADACDRGTLAENLPDIQSSLNSIQLFGTRSQIAEVEAFVIELDRTGKGSMNKLLANLRDEIRRELELSRITGFRFYIRAE